MINKKINTKTEEFESILEQLSIKDSEIKTIETKIIQEILSEESKIRLESLDNKELYSISQSTIAKNKDLVNKKLREYDAQNNSIKRDVYEILSIYNKSLALLKFNTGNDLELFVKKEVNSKKQEIMNINIDINNSVSKKDKIKTNLKNDIEKIIHSIDAEYYSDLLENNTIIKLLEELNTVLKSNETNDSKLTLNKLELCIKIVDDIYIYVKNKITSLELDSVELSNIITESKNIESIIEKVRSENEDLYDLKTEDIELLIGSLKKEKVDE